MKTKLHWIYGRHSVEAVLNSDKREISRVVVGNENDAIIELAQRRRIVAETMDGSFFDSIFGKNAIHQSLFTYNLLIFVKATFTLFILMNILFAMKMIIR